MRLHTYFQKQQAALRNAGVVRCPTFRVTPGMYRELQAEAGHHVDVLPSCQGMHPVQVIECPTRATGHNVILAPREDLFVENEDGVAGFQCVSLENDVTAIPDNIACVEVISVGEMVQNVRVGDLAFIDFFDVKQAYILDNEELYLGGCEAFKARYDLVSKDIVPLANYVTTKHAPDRFKVALTGTDRVHIPDYVTTDGIAGGKTSGGDTSTSVLYQEVVAVGPLTERAFPGLMTAAEKRLLDMLMHTADVHAGEAGERLLNYISEVRRERQRGRAPDIKPGELVVFCKEVAQKLRVRGEFRHLLPYSAVLATIDDEELLARGIRKGKAGKLVRVA